MALACDREGAEVKFRSDSEETACGKRVAGDLSDKYDDLGGLACMRSSGHTGDCIALMRDAADADGVCFGCREKHGRPHSPDCFRATKVPK